MSLVKCPECKKKVSEMADACPRCGYPIRQHQFVPKQKMSKKKKYLIVSVICVVVTIIFLIVVGLVGELISDYMYQKEIEAELQERGRLFQLSDINPADVYGLSNEHNILGEPISEILEGYVENEDYTISSNEYFTSYTFKMKDAYENRMYVNSYSEYNSQFSFEDANLVIYTDSSDDKITMISYEFRVEGDLLPSTNMKIKRLRKVLTDYYDVDPTYTFVSDFETVEIDGETYDSLIAKDFKSLYNIYWETKNGDANFYYANTNKESSNICSVSFTK